MSGRSRASWLWQEPRKENNGADNGRGDGGEKDCASGEVFRPADAGMALWMYRIGQFFESRVKRFSRENEADGQNDSEPLRAGDVEGETERDGCCGEGEMDAGVHSFN